MRSGRCVYVPAADQRVVPVEAASRHAGLEGPCVGEAPQPQSDGGLLAPVLSGFIRECTNYDHKIN